MADGQQKPPLTIEDTKEIIARLGDLNEDIVLIGGQAVNFWSARYAERNAVLDAAPRTSADIDFAGTKTLCARAPSV